MIQELLECTITELMDSRYEISEFQLGKEPYELLKEELESMVSNFKVDISVVNTYRNIPVKLHPSKDAVMYCLQLKKYNNG